jgi:hypothetical protein
VISQVEIFILKDKLVKVNSQLEKSAKGFFGPQTSSSSLRSYVATPSLLKKNLEAELNKEREIAKLMGHEVNSSFEYLKELSSLVPKDLITDLMDYQVGSSSQQSFLHPEVQTSGAVALHFTVANPQIAEKLTNLIQSKIKNFSKSALEEVKGADGSKKWKITYKGVLAEASSGGSKK